MDQFGFWTEFGEGILAVVGGFALIASRTPNASANKFLQAVLSAVNLMAANFGNASNAAPAEPPEDSSSA